MKELKINELRVGNWISVQDDGVWSHMQVTNIITKRDGQTNWVDCGSQGFVLDDMSDGTTEPDLFATGIPLDETVLAKCGFVIHTEYIVGVGMAKWWKYGSGLSLMIDAAGKLYFIPYSDRVYMDSLHQLQNFIFSATGSELTYTP